MHSTKRLWAPEVRARQHLKRGPNIILAIMRHGCSILTATISRSFIKAEWIFIGLRSPAIPKKTLNTLQPVVRRHCALGAGVQHGWLSPTQRTERIRIPECARQSPRTVALPRPAGAREAARKWSRWKAQQLVP